MRGPHPCSVCGLTSTAGKAKRDDQWRGTAASRGYDAAWKRTRDRILAFEPFCRHCTAQGLTILATEVDHVIPKDEGGTDDDSNLCPLCHSHHVTKTHADKRRQQRERVGA